MSGLGASALACAVLAGCAAGACAIPWARWLLARRGIPEGKGHPAWAWATVPAGAAAFVLVVRTSGWGIEAAELLALEWVLLTSCVTDLSAHLIPNPCVAGAVASFRLSFMFEELFLSFSGQHSYHPNYLLQVAS